MKAPSLKQHPLSAAFPSIPASEFGALVEDIRAHGLREPGVLYEGMVLDGWHRYRACAEADVEFRSVPIADGQDPRAWVLSRNLHRRHMTASQRAAAIVACTEWRSRGGDQSAVAADCSAPTAKALAVVADVSARTIEQAKAAHESGHGKAVIDGMVTAEDAETMAKIAETGEIPERAERKATKQAKKPANKPAEKPAKARKPAKPSNQWSDARVDELKARVAELEAHLAEAIAERDEAKDGAQALADECGALRLSGDPEIERKCKQLVSQCRNAERRRDELMVENAELKKSVKFWQRKANG